MRYLLILLFTGCIQPQPAVVYNCEIEKLDLAKSREKLHACKDRLIDLEERCNPAYGNWKNCDNEVYNRWYNGCVIEYDIQE